MGEESTRRRVLASLPATAALLAGCSGDGDRGPTTVAAQTPSTETRETATGTPVGFAESCGGVVEPVKSGASAELTYARTEAGTELLREAVSAFEASSGHSITLERHVRAAPPVTKLTAEVPEDEGPHLFQWSHAAAGKWADQGEGDGFLAEQVPGLRVDRCQYVDPAWDAANYGGRTVGLPLSGETVALYYDRDVVDAPPETFDELVGAAADSHDPAAGQYGFSMPIDPYYVAAFAQAYGTPIYDGEADELGVGSGDLQRGLAHLFDRLGPYMPEGPDREPQTRAFRDGNATFHVNGPWVLEAFREGEVNYGVTTLPSLPDGGTPRPYLGVQLLYFMPKTEKDPDGAVAAREFAEWFTTSREWLLEQAERADYVPVHAELVGDDRLSEEIRVFSDQLRTAYPMPQDPKMNDVWGPFGDAVVRTFEGDGELAATLAAAEDEIREAWADD